MRVDFDRMSKIGVCLGIRTCFVALPLSTDSVQICQNLAWIWTFRDSESRWVEGDPSVDRLLGVLGDHSGLILCLMDHFERVGGFSICLFLGFRGFGDW